MTAAVLAAETVEWFGVSIWDPTRLLYIAIPVVIIVGLLVALGLAERREDRQRAEAAAAPTTDLGVHAFDGYGRPSEIPFVAPPTRSAP
jgi:hypothetical protein